MTRSRKCPDARPLLALGVALVLAIGLFALLGAPSEAQAVIAMRGAPTTSSSATSGLTISKPAGVQPSDVMIVNIAKHGNVLETTGTGWTLVSSADLAGSTPRRGTVLRKVAVAGEPSQYTFNLGTSLPADSPGAVGAIVAYSGVDNTTPIEAVGTLNVSPQQVGVSAAATSTLSANARVIMFGMAANQSGTGTGPTFVNNSWSIATSPATALTELYDFHGPTVGTAESVGAAEATKTVAGSTGAGSATLSAATRNGGVLVALKPGSTTTTLTVTATASNKVYDGGTTASVVCTATGIAPGDSVTITYTPPATFNNKNVGNGKLVTVSGISLTGADAAKYVLSSTTATTTANITAKGLDLNAVIGSKTYDGGVTSTGTPTVTGLVGGDTVSPLVQTFDSKNAGGRTLSVSSYTVNDGNSGSNYTVTTHTAIGSISAKALSVTAVTATKTYDGGVTSTGTPTVVGLVAPDSAVATQTYDTKNVGTGKTLSVSAYTVTDGNSGNNYSVSTNTNTTGVISVKGLTITGLSASDKTYDGSTNATLTGTPALSGVISPDVVDLDGTGAGTFANANVGPAKAVTVTGFSISGAGASNYTVAQPTGLTATISAKGLTITGLSASDKTYDGSTNATLTGTPALSGVIDPDVVVLDGPG
ncbi:MAG: YDG domain-containing protein, partial [Actinomycetes bacterium]